MNFPAYAPPRFSKNVFCEGEMDFTVCVKFLSDLGDLGVRDNSKVCDVIEKIELFHVPFVSRKHE